MKFSDNVLRGSNKLRFRSSLAAIKSKLSRTDRDDFYTFKLTKSSVVNARVSRLKSTIGIELYQAKASKRKVLRNIGTDPFRQLKKADIRSQLRRIPKVSSDGKRSQSLDLDLDPGVYYLRIQHKKGQTRYRLKASKQDQGDSIVSDSSSPSSPMNPDVPTNLDSQTQDGLGNSPENAYVVAETSFTTTGTVGGNDAADYLSVSFSQISDVNLSLNGAEATLFFDMNGDGSITGADRTVATVADGGAIAQPLLSGQYFVKVTSPDSSTRSYTLTLSHTPSALSTRDAVSGYGVIDAAAAVALARGSAPFPDVPFVDYPLYTRYPDGPGFFWGQDAIKAPEVHAQGITGKGVTVAIISTGVDYTSQDFSQNIWLNEKEIPFNQVDDDGNGYVDDWRGWNFVDNNFDIREGSPSGEGTGLAGILATQDIRTPSVGKPGGEDFPPFKPFDITGRDIGIAPGVEIMPLRVFPGNNALAQDIADAIYYAVNNGADVINLSFVNQLGDGPISAIDEALQFARDQNVVAIMPAGDDSSSQSSLTQLPSLGLVAGAVHYNFQIPDFFNRAASTALPYFLAPGGHIYTTTDNEAGDYFDLYGYKAVTGTTYATAFISGTVALMLEANPHLTPQQVEDILAFTANSEIVEA